MNLFTRQISKGILFSALMFLCVFPNAYGQTPVSVEGTISDSTSKPMIGASVRVVSGSDSITTATDAKGNFLITAADTSFSITVTAMGFVTFTKDYTFSATEKKIRLAPIMLKEYFDALEEVVVTAIIPVTVKEDTVQFDARAYQVRPGDAVEEMVKKLPGVEVDKDGNITTEGEPITRVRLNGKDFFGDDASAALQNLPADIVKNLQIIDDYGELARIAGIKSGEPSKILNINTQPDKETGHSLKGTAGVGSHDRYSGRLRANKFTDDRQLSFDGVLNNTSSGDGIRTNRFAKANYRANWGDKMISYGSYRFNSNKNFLQERIVRQDFYKDYTQFDEESKLSESNANAHRFDWNLEYQIDKNNYLKVEPNLSFNSTASVASGITNSRLLSTSSLRDYTTAIKGNSSGFGTEIFYNHKFGKAGRNISLEADLNASGDEQLRDVSNDYTVIDSLQDRTTESQRQFWNSRNQRTTTGTEISYFEPVSTKSFIEFEYEWDRSENRSIRDVTSEKGIDSTVAGLNNNYKYQFTTNRIGLNFQHRDDKYHYVVGVTAQPAILSGQDLSRNITTSKKTFNLIPVARFFYTFDKKRTFRASLTGRSNQPSFIQLQPIADNSNLQNTVIGNPNLKPELVNRLQLRYNQSGRGSGYDFFTSLNFSQTQNKIVTSRVIVTESLKQQTTFVNANGFYTANGNYSITKRFANRKYSVNYYGGSNYSRNIAFNNNQRNIGNNINVSQGLKLGVDIDDVIDTRLHAAYSVNKTTYSLESFQERNTRRFYLGLEGRNYFLKHWIIGYDLSKTINRGFNTADVDPMILNTYIEYQFLKNDMGRIRLQGFDLFNQNTGISRDVFDNQIIDRQTNRLGRFFMLSFGFRLDKFGGNG